LHALLAGAFAGAMTELVMAGLVLRCAADLMADLRRIDELRRDAKKRVRQIVKASQPA
jgi:hypothetical protein